MAMIHIDYETRSAADLKTLGVWAYAAHPTTSVLTAFLESDEGWRVFWTPVHCAGWAPPAGMEYRWGYEWLAQLFHAGNIFVAHNAEFERAMSEVNLHLPEVTWIDTMALADYLALPGGLDDLAKHLYGVGKDKAGYQLMMRMCKPSARYGDPNNHGFVPFTPESLTAYALYNARDVDLAKRFYEGHHRDWDDCEEPVYHWHMAVNKRGLRIDTDAAAGLRDICLQIAERAGATVTQATMHYAVNGTSMRLVGSDLTRVAHLTRWFNVVGAMHGGWSIDSCDEETLTTMLAQPLDVVPPVARAVAEARLSVSLASIKKVDAALNQISGDGRLRGQYRYAGAHTHRWTGRGMQPQNLPRPLPWLEEEALNKPQRPQAELVTLLLDACRSRDLGTFAQAHAAVEAYAKSKTDGKAVVGVNECLTSLIRPLIIPAEGYKLIGADFAQIEGRVAAWMSGDRAAIKAFEDNDAGVGPDVYCVMASAIFGRTITKKDKNERQAGKAAELLSTYGGGHKLLDSRHHDDFVRAGVTAEYVTNKWRELHRPTARYWRVLETAMRDTIAGRRGGSRFEAGPVVYERGRNGEVLLRFPSGRTMRYYDAQIESDDEYEGRTSIVYNSYKKGGGKNDRAGRIHLWGGHLLENADQSLSRDLLTSAALRIEAYGIQAVMHTHDELVFEVPDAQVAEAAEIVRREMATPPAWAPGLPIKGDPAVMIRYNKDA